MSLLSTNATSWRTMLSSYPTIDTIGDKIKLYSALNNCDETSYISYMSFNPDFIKSKLGHLFYKPVHGAGSKNVFSSENFEGSFLAMEKIKFDAEYTIDILCMSGTIVDYCIRERKYCSGGICVHAKTWGHIWPIGKGIEQLTSIVKNLQLHGPFAIQFLFEKAKNRIVFTDINHRFGGGSMMSVKCGWKGVENYVKFFTGESFIMNYKIKPLEIRRQYVEIKENRQ